jgi:hypothetical protein
VITSVFSGGPGHVTFRDTGIPRALFGARVDSDGVNICCWGFPASWGYPVYSRPLVVSGGCSAVWAVRYVNMLLSAVGLPAVSGLVAWRVFRALIEGVTL